jgi:HAD superfamily hydrolase (TIGR01549 family)
VAPIKAVITDYLGTLTNAHNYTMEVSRIKLYSALVEAGFKIDLQEFLEAYMQAHEKYRTVRYVKLREVTNAIWISESLNNLGLKTSQEDPSVKVAINRFFQDFVDSLKLRPYAKKLIGKIAMNYKLGLVSNFTYAPVIYASLRKLGIDQFFNAVLVSDEIGWRKPHKKIFENALEKLQVRAEETLYVGDSPLEDIKGAKAAGMKTIFVPSQFFSMKDLQDSKQKPDIIVKNICELCRKFPEILKDN